MHIHTWSLDDLSGKTLIMMVHGNRDKCTKHAIMVSTIE